MSLDNKVVDLADLKVSHDYLLGQDELLSDRINELGSGIDGIQSQITALGNGSPIPVETVAEMTDNTKAYLYTGSEQGYTSGYWYTYDSTQAKFVPRGEYGAGVIIDSTLTVTGNAADAKATGDAIKAWKTFVVQVPGSAAVLSGSITAGDFAKALAAYTAGSGVYAVKDGEVYQLSAASSSTMTFTQMYHGTMNFIKQIQITSADTFTVTNTALSSSAADTSYNNTTSGLTATDVQAAIDENAVAIDGVNGRLQEFADAIDFESNVILSNSDLTYGLWTSGGFRTDGAYGKYKSNQEPFPITSFHVDVDTADYTDLVISVTCFDVNKARIANFITNNVVIQSGSYAVGEADILNARPTTKYIAVAIGKVSGSTYEDLPSDITITVEKTADTVTIAERVAAIEAVMDKGASVIVAQNGGGHFTTIQAAVDYITDDSASKPYTIYIKPGIYDEHIHLGGSRYISFVGENRENCIIRSHTGMYTDAPLWLDGNFTIENLTLQMLDDEAPDTWTPGTSQSDPATMLPGYALHVDGGAASSPDAVYGYRLGVVRNCTLFSVAFPAIGAGLHSNQKLIFENCDFIRRTSAKYHNDQYQYYTNYNGAMIIHDSTRAADSVNQNLDIIKCRFLCNLGKAATFRFRYGTPANVKYALIDTTFWSDSDGAVVDAVLNDSVLLGYSHGNNISDFNSLSQ